jgi:MraZ protein
LALVFSGKYKYIVDAKGRINIPAPFRNQLSNESDNTFHITFGPNECLFVYPREVFQDIASKLEEKYGSLATPEEERRYFLETMSNAQPSRCDQQGRITAPKDHLEYAGIESDVLIIGAVNKMEFWNPYKYQEFVSRSSHSQKERVQKYGGADRS